MPSLVGSEMCIRDSSSHRAPRKLPTARFDSKFNSLSFGGVGTRLHEILPLKHKSSHSSSHRAPQKLSTPPFDSKFSSLSFGLAKSGFYDILPWNTFRASTPRIFEASRPRILQCRRMCNIPAPSHVQDSSTAACAIFQHRRVHNIPAPPHVQYSSTAETDA